MVRVYFSFDKLLPTRTAASTTPRHEHHESPRDGTLAYNYYSSDTNFVASPNDRDRGKFVLIRLPLASSGNRVTGKKKKEGKKHRLAFRKRDERQSPNRIEAEEDSAQSVRVEERRLGCSIKAIVVTAITVEDSDSLAINTTRQGGERDGSKRIDESCETVGEKRLHWRGRASRRVAYHI